MTILVTGASGFIGGHLVRRLMDEGHPVRALVRPTSDTTRLRDWGVPLVVGDLTKPDSLRPALEGATAVVHLAALSTDWGDWALFRVVNVEGVRHLTEMAAQVEGLRRFVHISTSDVYGHPNSPGLDETAPLRKRNMPYVDTKIEGEQMAWRAHHELGLPLSVIRPVNVYGPGSKDFVVEIVEFLRQRMVPLVDGGRHDFGLVYVDNLVDALLLALEHPKAVGQAFNVQDGFGITFRRYVEALAEALGLPRPWLSLPHGVAYGVGYLMEKVWGLLRLRQRPPLTRHAVELIGTDQGFSADKIRRMLGWQPRVSFEEGIARTVAWLHEARIA